MMLYKSMNEKELKKLNRKQLLELLLRQTEYADELREQLDQMKHELENRKLLEKEAGSIAEASLKLNGVFESAQAAADQYLENIQNIHNNHVLLQKKIDDEYSRTAKAMINDVKIRCNAYEKECKERANRIITEAEERSRRRDQESKRVLAEVKYLYRYLTEEKLKLTGNK